MRLFLFLALSCLASAEPSEVLVPRPAPPKGLEVRMPLISRWNSAEKARVVALTASNPLEASLGRPRLDLPLLPYPALAPARARGYLLFQ
ncbi:MAG: hypothetical protein HY014_15565 [Acidobacteria bacterium]|nr:hypothetical protein [Acidobacteriota bacterium]MBI3489576.1 hypothetical protein [Acidobacteriota bacterium]